MKNNCWQILVVLLVSVYAMLTAAQEQKTTVPPQLKHVMKEAICHRTTGPMEIDGRLSDWEDVAATEAMVLGETENIQKPKRYKGPQDASALVYTKWDDKYFYVVAVVTDDIVRNSHVEKELQEGDGLLVCFSPKTPDQFPTAKPGEPTPRYPYGFIVTAGDDDKIKSQFMTIMDANKNPVVPPGPWLDEVKKAARRTKYGYNLELALPFSAMPELKPTVGRAIGCEICLYESDTRLGPTKRTTIIGWCSVKDRMNPAEGGRLIFAEASKEKPANPVGTLRAQELIKNPYTPPTEGYLARKPHDAFAAAGLPCGLYFERAERESILRKLRDDRMERLFKRISVMCDSYLATWQPEKYSLKTLTVGDAAMVSKVIQRLGFFYTMTEEDEYADLARRTMLRLCEQRANWAAPLDTPQRVRVAAELLKALAIGRDWIYNALNMEERTLVEKTLTEVGDKITKAASMSNLSRCDRIIALCAVGVCGSATRQRSEKAKDWMLAAEKSAAEFVTSAQEQNPDELDAALFAIFTLIDPLKKALGHDLFSMTDMRTLITRRADLLKTKVDTGWAIDTVSIRYASRLHACVLLREAAENRDGLAMWLYQSVFTDLPSSTRDADEIYTLLWFDDTTKPTPPFWYNEKSQKELALRLDKSVHEACRVDAAARQKARQNLRHTVREQRAQPVPFSADWLGKLDEKKVLADFQVTIKPALLKQHPRLFFTREQMPLLYARIATCGSAMWERFFASMESNLEAQYRTMASFREQGSLGTGTGDTLAQFAFTYSLTGDDAHGELLKRFVLGYCKEEIWDPPYPDLVHAHVLAGLALAYDVGQKCLMPEERDMVRDKLIIEARRSYNGTCPPKRFRTPGNANNHSWIQKCGLAIAATAIYEHTPEAKTWLDRVRWEYQKILEIHGPDGASCEGTSYWAYGLMWMLRYMELLWHTSGEDMYEHPWLRHTGYYALYCLAPGGALHVNFGDNSEDQARVSMIPYRLASEFRDEHIQWLGDQLQWSPNIKGKPGANIWAFLWYDPTVSARPPDDLPPYRYFDDLEMVVVKSSWKDDARMLAFRCGPPMGYSVFEHSAGGYGHAHPDQNHFIFYAGGSRFIISDPGYSRWKMTNEHNLILVDGLGQIGEEAHWLHYEYKADELAEMQDVFLSPAYSYMRGEAHRAYRRECGVRNYTRQMMFVDGYYLVVLDSIECDVPRKFEWLLHSWNPIEGPQGNVFTLTQDEARVATALLVPQSFEHKMEPMLVKSAVKWGIDGRPIYIQEPVQHGYYLSAWPKVKASKAYFLAVHWPYKKGEESSVPKFARIEDKGYLGAEIISNKQRDKVLYNLSESPIEADGIVTDARCAFVRTSEVYEPVAYILHEGKALTCGACELLKADVPVVAQLDTTKGEGVLECNAMTDVELYVPHSVKRLTVNGAPVSFTYDANTKSLKFKAEKKRLNLKFE